MTLSAINRPYFTVCPIHRAPETITDVRPKDTSMCSGGTPQRANHGLNFSHPPTFSWGYNRAVSAMLWQVHSNLPRYEVLQAATYHIYSWSSDKGLVKIYNFPTRLGQRGEFPVQLHLRSFYKSVIESYEPWYV